MPSNPTKVEVQGETHAHFAFCSFLCVFKKHFLKIQFTNQPNQRFNHIYIFIPDATFFLFFFFKLPDTTFFILTFIQIETNNNTFTLYRTKNIKSTLKKRFKFGPMSGTRHGIKWSFPYSSVQLSAENKVIVFCQ